MSSSEQQNVFKNVSTACNNFAIPLYRNLVTNIDNNIITSPLSLYMILSLLFNGSGGSTLNELKSVLYYDNAIFSNNEFESLIYLLKNIKGTDLRIANAMYIQDGFQLMADFLSTYTNVFQSISRINFENIAYSVETINTWVQEATNNKISNIISSDNIDEDTKIVLVNAIYFKSKWLDMFDEKDTTKRNFYISETETNLVPIMFKKSNYVYGEIPAWHTKFIEIPYSNQDFVMTILLPNKETDLQTLEKNFNWETLANAPKSIDRIELYLPRFKFEIAINMEDVLRKIGLNTIFEDSADFTHLSSIPLKVSHVVQKIFIEVNEEGSEAAAATECIDCSYRIQNEKECSFTDDVCGGSSVSICD
ncbi:antichymotrypsin-2 isoform X2 [Linepithema humile]|uniref:antichymotrypsin-2 isoform X2 n=1 Tax=Linepithema humile TaxID=83485 RepID=UPI00351ED685